MTWHIHINGSGASDDKALHGRIERIAKVFANVAHMLGIGVYSVTFGTPTHDTTALIANGDMVPESPPTPNVTVTPPEQSAEPKPPELVVGGGSIQVHPDGPGGTPTNGKPK